MDFKLFINDDAQNIFVVSKSNKVVAQWSQSVSKKVNHTTKVEVETANREKTYESKRRVPRPNRLTGMFRSNSAAKVREPVKPQEEVKDDSKRARSSSRLRSMFSMFTSKKSD